MKSKRSKIGDRFTRGRWWPIGARVETEPENVADICSTLPADFGQGWSRRTDDEIMENARLIAAAPYMLGQLREARCALGLLDKTTLAAQPESEYILEVAAEIEDFLKDWPQGPEDL